MRKREALFNSRILRSVVARELQSGIVIPPLALERITHWADLLRRGVLDRMSESSAEQTFNAEIFGTVLGYQQIGSTNEATLLPKRTGPGGRDTPDFILGRFDPGARVEEWGAVGEIKNSRTDLDQPQVGRSNKETPVEQGFRYASRGKPGVEWIIVTNFRQVRLYKNGYVGAYHVWNLEELTEPEKLAEFYILLRPEGLLNIGREPAALRAFKETISAGKELTEGFYGLYKEVQRVLFDTLSVQPAALSLTKIEVLGKTHKLLNRVLFIAFCEKHPAELVPRETLRSVALRARADGNKGAYWKGYRKLFHFLNVGGGLEGVALNAFNGGLFAKDSFFEAVEIPDELFTRRFRTGRGRRQSLEIIGIFGFDIYDFADDLNEQALGAIFEQSLKDMPQAEALVRGVGETTVTSQESGGVYYTPREITSHLMRAALTPLFDRIDEEARQAVAAPARQGPGKLTPKGRKIAHLVEFADRFQKLKIMDPACGSGAFLVEALDQLMFAYDKINRSISELTGNARQRSLLDLDRMVLRENLHGRDILPESVEISRLSIWLRTAKRGEKLESLARTITAGDTLRSNDKGSYDAIVGNPPWGAELEGWTKEELSKRFPQAGSELDSYAIFVMRAWELLRPNGVLAFIIPNSWLTVSGYTQFRAWLIASFEVLEVTNVWKIFTDVNHDACILVARKRERCLQLNQRIPALDVPFTVRAIARGRSELEKLRQLAEGKWALSHETTHLFQFRQPEHRFEVIYRPEVADELDRLAARCHRLDEVADVTVGIQVYHHTRVSKDFIKQRGFHSLSRQGNSWHPYIDANEVQRYYACSATTQWLHYNEKLRDKRELEHYAKPRILIQQIFWQRLSTVLQEPTEPLLYLNTLFAIFNAREVPLECLLGIINSRFISGSYERRANRLFGDKFPKVSKADLASIPIPKMSPTTMQNIGRKARELQEAWQELRSGLQRADEELAGLRPGMKLSALGAVWMYTEAEFRTRAVAVLGGGLSTAETAQLKATFQDMRRAINSHWGSIQSGEAELEELVRNAYRVPQGIYREILDDTPAPTIEWAVRAWS